MKHGHRGHPPGQKPLQRCQPGTQGLRQMCPRQNASSLPSAALEHLWMPPQASQLLPHLPRLWTWPQLGAPGPCWKSLTCCAPESWAPTLDCPLGPSLNHTAAHGLCCLWLPCPQPPDLRTEASALGALLQGLEWREQGGAWLLLCLPWCPLRRICLQRTDSYRALRKSSALGNPVQYPKCSNTRQTTACAVKCVIRLRNGQKRNLACGGQAPAGLRLQGCQAGR